MGREIAYDPEEYALWEEKVLEMDRRGYLVPGIKRAYPEIPYGVIEKIINAAQMEAAE